MKQPGDIKMPRRIAITERWNEDAWFGELPLRLKIFYIYLCDRCDCAGIWEPNWRVADFEIGEHFDPEDTLQKLQPKVTLLPSGKWVVANFVYVQYRVSIADLKPEKNTVHLGVVRRLAKEGLWDGPVPDRVGPEVPVVAEGFDAEGRFEAAWEAYPEKSGKKAAIQHFIASVRSEEDFQSLMRAMGHYLKSPRVLKGFVQNGSTWFNNWKDWIEYTGEIKLPSGTSEALKKKNEAALRQINGLFSNDGEPTPGQ
jgi:hypothetical protein